MTTIEEMLQQAETKLTIASGQVYASASHVEPFRASKFLNVLGKELSQIKVELAIFLGNLSTDVKQIEETGYSLPSTALLRVMQEDKELNWREKTQTNANLKKHEEEK